MGACIGKIESRKSLQKSSGFLQAPSSTIHLKQKKSSITELQRNEHMQNKSRQTSFIQMDLNQNSKVIKANGQHSKDQFVKKLNQIQFNNDEQLRAITRSSIIKVIKKMNPKDQITYQSPKQQEYQLNREQENQLHGQFQSSKKFEDTLRIRLTNLDIQFMLPKIQAGPLIVPFIDFNQYQTS